METDPSSRESNGRKNIANILQGLGFEDTPESRKLDPWMTAVLARDKQQQEIKSSEQDEIPKIHDHEGFLINKLTAAPVKNQLVAKSKKSSMNNDHLKSNNLVDEKNLLASKLPGKLPIKKERDKYKSNSGSASFKKTVPAPPVVEKQLPMAMRNKIIDEMGGSDLVFVIEKRMTETDVGQRQNRLSVPKRQVVNQFLEEDEEARLNTGEGIKIKFLIFNQDYKPDSDHEIKVNDIDLKLWEMRTTMVYALNGMWHYLVQEYELKAGMLVQLWAFRVQSQLYLALIKLHDQPMDH